MGDRQNAVHDDCYERLTMPVLRERRKGKSKQSEGKYEVHGDTDRFYWRMEFLMQEMVKDAPRS